MKLSVLRGLRPDQQVDLEQLLRLAVDEVIELLSADRGTVYLVDHARAASWSAESRTCPSSQRFACTWVEGIAGWVADSGETVNVPSGSDDPRFANRIDAETGYETRSMLVAPVPGEKDGAIIGVLQVLNKRSGKLRPRGRAALARPLLARSPHSWRGRACAVSCVPVIAYPWRFASTTSSASPRQCGRCSTARPAPRAPTPRSSSAARADRAKRSSPALCTSTRRGRKKPLVKVDCAALPEQLIENELFGHEKGAFTGADRTETMARSAPPTAEPCSWTRSASCRSRSRASSCASCRRRPTYASAATRPQQVDVRFVCATHRDLETEVAEGRFRQDLYYRLRVVQIDVPPLRDRGVVDLDRLIDHFHYEFTQRHGRPKLQAGQHPARSALHAHDWPGNVRELEHCVESAVVLCPAEVVEAEHLTLGPSGRPSPQPPLRGEGEDGPARFSAGVRPPARRGKGLHSLRARNLRRQPQRRRPRARKSGRNTLPAAS